MVRYLKLSDGKQIPALGFGTGSFGHLGKHDRVVQDGAIALKAGFRHLDTAQLYDTEAAVGESIRKSGFKRDEVFVTSKLSGNKVNATTPEAIRSAVQSTLDNLGFKPDVLLVHNPYVFEQGKIGEGWKILEDLVEDGLLAGVSLGVSNFRPQDIQAILDVCRIKPVINQMEYHPYILAQISQLAALQTQHGIHTQAYGPLVPLIRHPDGGPIKPILERIAQRLSKESGKEVAPTTALLLWTIGMGVSVVTTSGNPDRIQALAEIDGLPDLTKEEIDEVTEAGKTIHFRYYSEHLDKDFPVPDLPTAEHDRVGDVKKWFGVDILPKN